VWEHIIIKGRVVPKPSRSVVTFIGMTQIHFGMENIKFIAGQARAINLYKNTRSKLLKCCANVCFNKQCLAKRVVPSYANIKCQNTSPVAQFTSKKAQITRIKDEIRFLFKNTTWKPRKNGAECGKGKGKAVPLQACSGPEGASKLRFPDFMTTAQDGGKVVSLTHWPTLPPGNAPGTHFC